MISPVTIWRDQQYIRDLINKTGKVITWNITYVPGSAFKEAAPYAVVMVQFEDGSRTVGQLVDYTTKPIEAGETVVAILRKNRQVSEEDVIPYGIKFKRI